MYTSNNARQMLAWSEGCGSLGALNGKRVLLGVTGGISVYKAIEVLRLLTKAGARVDVVMTPSAVRFVTPATFRGLSGRPVIVDLYDLPGDLPDERRTMPHLDIAEGADIALVVPATANTLAKMAWGLADNALTTTLLSVTADVLVAPAMDTDMWWHPATQENVRRLRERGVTFVGPEQGALARMNVGAGRLAEPASIVAGATELLARRLKGEVPERSGAGETATARDLTGRNVLVTAGGTREPIDPVRYIGNRSSGKMGYAIAARAQERGAAVTLISAPSALASPRGCDLVRVETALQMKAAVEERLEASDVVVMAAAVADFRPEFTADQKVKKGGRESWEVRLVRTPDISAAVGARKRSDQVLVAFAAETENLMENAKRKLEAKNADLIVANDVSKEGSGFEVDTNEVTLLFRNGEGERLPLLSKERVADLLLDHVVRLLNSTTCSQ